MRIRHKEIRRRRQRNHKVNKLKARLALTKDAKDRQLLIEKIRKHYSGFQPE